MKKLLAIAMLPAFAALTACTSVPLAQPTPDQVQAIQANSQTFKCDNNTEVVSMYTQRNGDNYANVKITSPMLGLNQAALVLKQNVSASGVRYTVSSADQNTLYDWQVKGAEGALTVTNNGTAYNFSCDAI